MWGGVIPGRSVGSLDDSDVLRIRSSSSFGWYDEGTMVESEEMTSAFRQIDDWRDLQPSAPLRRSIPSTAVGLEQSGGCVAEPEQLRAPKDGGDSGVGAEEEAGVKSGKAEIEFEIKNDHITTTRTFYGPKARPIPYAVAIGSIRVINGGSGHAQYQVVVSSDDNIWKAWKRYSDFKLLAEYAKVSDMKAAAEAWGEVQNTQRWFRCLDADYLRSKCFFLEKFLAQLLFELPSPQLLLTFVQAFTHVTK